MYLLCSRKSDWKAENKSWLNELGSLRNKEGGSKGIGVLLLNTRTDFALSGIEVAFFNADSFLRMVFMIGMKEFSDTSHSSSSRCTTSSPDKLQFKRNVTWMKYNKDNKSHLTVDDAGGLGTISSNVSTGTHPMTSPSIYQ